MINDDIIKEYLKQNDIDYRSVKNAYLLKDDGNGNTIAKWGLEIPQPTEADIQAIKTQIEENKLKELCANEVKKILHEKAVEKDYNNEQSVISYLSSSNATWASEAQQYLQWRDRLWNYAYEYMSNVETGIIPQPSVEDFKIDLPQLIWS